MFNDDSLFDNQNKECGKENNFSDKLIFQDNFEDEKNFFNDKPFSIENNTLFHNETFDFSNINDRNEKNFFDDKSFFIENNKLSNDQIFDCSDIFDTYDKNFFVDKPSSIENNKLFQNETFDCSDINARNEKNFFDDKSFSINNKKSCHDITLLGIDERKFFNIFNESPYCSISFNNSELIDQNYSFIDFRSNPSSKLNLSKNDKSIIRKKVKNTNENENLYKSNLIEENKSLPNSNNYDNKVKRQAFPTF
jgi:hypothetical protein